MAEKNSFVFYETFLDTINKAKNDTEKLALYQAIVRYGLYGEKPKDHVLDLVMTQITYSIDSAKERYDKAVNDGKKGGRPKKGSIEEIRELIDEGKTKKEICEFLGISEKTYSRRVKEINYIEPVIDESEPKIDIESLRGEDGKFRF